MARSIPADPPRREERQEEQQPEGRAAQPGEQRHAALRGPERETRDQDRAVQTVRDAPVAHVGERRRGGSDPEGGHEQQIRERGAHERLLGDRLR